MKNYQLLVTRKNESLAAELPAYYRSRHIKNSRSVLSRNLNYVIPFKAEGMELDNMLNVRSQWIPGTANSPKADHHPAEAAP